MIQTGFGSYLASLSIRVMLKWQRTVLLMVLLCACLYVIVQALLTC